MFGTVKGVVVVPADPATDASRPGVGIVGRADVIDRMPVATVAGVPNIFIGTSPRIRALAGEATSPKGVFGGACRAGGLGAGEPSSLPERAFALAPDAPKFSHDMDTSLPRLILMLAHDVPNAPLPLPSPSACSSFNSSSSWRD